MLSKSSTAASAGRVRTPATDGRARTARYLRPPLARPPAASCFFDARRLVSVVTVRTSTMKPSEKGMLISGTWTPDSCSACRTSLTPMKPRMIDRP